MYYDPLGRVVKTVNPDNSQQWVVHGIPKLLNEPPDPFPVNNLFPSTLSRVEGYIQTPWVTYSYDSNDLADVSNVAVTNVPPSHYYTPKSSEIDPLGRTIKTTEYFDNTDYANVIEMNYFYDVRGNLLLVKDPYDRDVFTHVYDLRTPEKDKPLPPLYTKHIDKGESTLLFDVTGKPIESFDAKGAQGLSAYDVLHRPTNIWAKNDSSFTDCTLRNYITYGDSAGLINPENDNLKGKVYNSYDEAGLIKTTLYDFKGNLLTKIRNVIDSAELKTALSTFDNYIIDWTSLPSILDATDYETDMEYDALNRITGLELPEDLDSERKKIIPTYNTAGALEKVDLYSPTGPTTTNYVENIAYNAKGQRLLIAFGNNRMTRYAYDPITFRLLRQRTEGYTKSVVGSTVTYAYSGGTNKQDDGFNYDLIGNIVNIFVRVTDCGIGGTPDELDRTFEYDPIYRLTYADGRESDTQSGNTYLYDDAPIPSTPLPGNVNYYARNYDYDKLGNINSVVQTGTNGFTRDYTYNTGQNTLQKIEDATPATIESYTYDNCGNTITTNLNRYYVWNHSDQLLCYYNDAGGGPTVFTQYDYAGQDRVSKMVRTGMDYERTIYIDGIFEYVKLESSSTYEKNYIHIMDDKNRIAEVRINPGTAFPGDITDSEVYILEDQIGSSVVRLNTSGTIIDEEEYYPFGDSSLRTFTYKRYRYVGKERDAESGLYYYGARYYAAWTCRFISVDPLAAKYQYLSPFAYAENRPIIGIDLDGKEFFPLYEITQALLDPDSRNKDDKGFVYGFLRSTTVEGMADKIISSVSALINSPPARPSLTEFVLDALGGPASQISRGFYEQGKNAYNGNRQAAGELTGDIALIFVGGLKPKMPLKVIEQDGLVIIPDLKGVSAGSASLHNGELTLSIKTTGTLLKGRGSDVFQTLFNFINKNYDKITSIRAVWKTGGGMESNLKQFNDYIAKGYTDKQAAAKTFTGENAKNLGFKNVKIENPVKDANGAYTNVEIVYTK